MLMRLLHGGNTCSILCAELDINNKGAFSVVFLFAAGLCFFALYVLFKSCVSFIYQKHAV